MNLRKYTIIGVVISLASLAWLLRDLDLRRLWDFAVGMRPGYALGAILLWGLSMFCRTWRWRILMSSMGKLSLGGVFSANLIGYMANNVLPARLGEFIRAYAARTILGVPAAGALASIVVERVLDGLAWCFALFLTLVFVDQAAQAGSFNYVYLWGIGAVFLSVFLGALAILVGLALWEQRVVAMITGLAGKISPALADRAGGFLDRFGQGLRALKHTKSWPGLLASTLLVWLLIFAGNIVFLPAVGLPMVLLLGALVLVGEHLAGMIPSAPGYIGTFQLAVFWSLSLGGAPEDQSMAYAMLFWALSYFILTTAGLIEMWRKGMSLGALRERGQKLAQADSASGQT